MQATKTEWDARNNVPVRHVEDITAIDHAAEEDLEYVIPSAQSRGLAVQGLYTPSASNTLVVSFHGSLQRTKYQLPRFEWRKTLRDLDAARLLLADTTLELTPSMPLGWYVGTAQQNLSEDIARVVGRIAEDGGYSRVVLTGSSGGGYAAMAVSHRLPGSAAVSFSPQTRIGDYVQWVHQAFVRAAFPANKDINDVEELFPDRVNLRRLYSATECPNFVRYVQNSNDAGHMESHYKPFAAARLIDAAGGLDSSGRIRLVLEAMQQGHQPPSRGRFLRHIQAAHDEFFGSPLRLLSS